MITDENMESLQPMSIEWKIAPDPGAVFLRNNKSDCSKRLRCFPKCCNAGHALKTFCGNEISCTLSTKL